MNGQWRDEQLDKFGLLQTPRPATVALSWSPERSVVLGVYCCLGCSWMGLQRAEKDQEVVTSKRSGTGS